MDHLDYLRQFWNTENIYQAMFERIHVDPELDKLKSDEEKIKVWHEIVKRDISRLTKGIPLQRTWRVLEIGCGIGRLILPLSEFFAQVDGVDISESMINFAADYLKNQKNVKVYLNNGEDLSGFNDNSYEFIFSVIVFQHIRSAKVVKSYLTEALRAMKPDGYFRFQVYMKNPLRSELGNYDTEAGSERHGFNGNAYTAGQLRQLLRETGFKRIELNEEGSWIWATARK